MARYRILLSAMIAYVLLVCPVVVAFGVVNHNGYVRRSNTQPFSGQGRLNMVGGGVNPCPELSLEPKTPTNEVACLACG